MNNLASKPHYDVISFWHHLRREPSLSGGGGGGSEAKNGSKPGICYHTVCEYDLWLGYKNLHWRNRQSGSVSLKR